VLRRSVRRVFRYYSPAQLDAPRAGGSILAAVLVALLVASCQESPVEFNQFPAAYATAGLFVQGTATSNALKTIAVPLAAATTKGNLVVVGFDYTGTTFTSIADNQGNAFTQVGTEITSPGGARTRLYYARNIKGGSETVTINLAANPPYLEVYAAEYAGIDTTTPLDVSAQATGSASSATSGSIVTTTANDVIVGLCIGDNSCTAGSGFTARSTYHSNLLEDRVLATAGSTAATGTASSGWAVIMAAFRPQSATPPAPVASVTVAPATASITAGTTQALSATTKDASGNVLTGRTVTWTTGNAAVVTVSATGVVTGVAVGGPVTITATSEGQSSSAAISVTPAPVATVTVAPATASLTAGTTQALTATTKDAAGNVLAGRTITWTTSGATIATVSATGVVTGVAAGGPVTITATSEGKIGTAAITVTLVPVASVAVTPATAAVMVGETAPLAAATKDAAGNVLTGRTITWTTSNAAVATVSATGVVTGVAAGGPVTITATSEGKTGTAAITVTLVPVASVTMAPVTASVLVGQTTSLTATAKDVSGNVLAGRTIAWTTSDAATATVSATGVVTGMAGGGPVTITATSEGQSGTAAVTVTVPPVATVTVAPAAASVAIGQTVALTATTKAANGALLTGRDVTWQTSDAAIATVSATGVVTGVAAGGPVTITATSEGQSGTAAVTVTVPVASVTVAPPTASVVIGQTVPLSVVTRDAGGNELTGRVIAWTTSDATVATVSAAGVVTGVAAGGPVAITATTEGQSGTAAITVTVPPVASVTLAPPAASVAAGQTVLLTATTKDAGGAVLTGRVISWESSDPSLATVSASGVVIGVGAGGPITITATSETVSGSTAITVLPAVASVTIEPATASVIVGQTVSLTATTSDATGTVLTGRVLAWTSSNPSQATVSATGVVAGMVAGGPVTITATSEGKSGTAAITVMPVPVASVTVAPATANLIVGQSVTFQATPKDAGGNTLAGRAITWATSDPTLATVSATGVVTGAAAGGPVTITASSEGQLGTAAATVQALSPTGYLYPLKVGPTSRYLVDQTGKPFFLAGDAAWSLFSQLSDQDADTYLAARQQSGFNLVMASVIEHKFASNAPRNIYGLGPFTGTNFTTPNEAYFAHVDYIVRSAAQKGIVVLMAPAYLGVSCGSEGWGAEIKAATDADMGTWGRYLGARYAGYDNIIWLVGGDTDPKTCGVTSRLQALVAGIQQFDTRHPFTAHNNSGQMAITPWSGASWLTINNFYTYSSTLYRQALTAYHVTPTMPFFLLESAYENEHSSTGQSLRAQSYWTVLSGGFGHIYGNCPVWSFASPGTSNFCSFTDWKAQLTSQGSRNIQYLQSMFSTRHWYALVPDEAHAAVTAGYGSNTSTGYVTAATASDGSSIIAYLPSSRTVTVNGRALGSSMTAWWYKPANGTATAIGTYSTASSRTFTPPSSGDWVLVVDNPSFSFPAP